MNNIFQYADLNETPFFPKVHSLPVLSEDIENILDDIKNTNVFKNIGGKIANYLKFYELQDDNSSRNEKVGFYLLFVENYEEYGVSPFVVTKGNINFIKDSLPVEMKVYFRSIGKVKSKDRVLDKASKSVKDYLRLVSVLSLDNLHITGEGIRTNIVFNTESIDSNLASYVIDKFYRERAIITMQSLRYVYFIQKDDKFTISTQKPIVSPTSKISTFILKDSHTITDMTIPTILETIAELLELKYIAIDLSAYKSNGQKTSNLEAVSSDSQEQDASLDNEQRMVEYLSLLLNAVDNVSLPANGKVLLCTTNDIELTAHQLNRPAVKALLARNKHIGIQFTPNSNPFDTNEYIVNLVGL